MKELREKILEILPMGGHVPLDTTEVRNKIEQLLLERDKEVREEEENRIKSIMDAEYYRIQFVAYPYSGIQIRDLMELKKAFFDKSKKGDAIRKTLFMVSKMQIKKLKTLKKE